MTRNLAQLDGHGIPGADAADDVDTDADEAEWSDPEAIPDELAVEGDEDDFSLASWPSSAWWMAAAMVRWATEAGRADEGDTVTGIVDDDNDRSKSI